MNTSDGGEVFSLIKVETGSVIHFGMARKVVSSPTQTVLYELIKAESLFDLGYIHQSRLKNRSISGC